MAVDPDILPTFLDEAELYLRVLRDGAAGRDAQRRAAHGLRGAAAMLGLRQLEACARWLEAELPRPADELAAQVDLAALLVETLRRTGAELEATDGGEPGDAPSRDGRAPRSLESPDAANEAARATAGFADDWDPATARQLRALFVEEAHDHLEAMGKALLRVGRERDQTGLEEMLRKTHTLKGSAATVGLQRVSEAAHRLEEQLVGLRDGKSSLGAAEVERLLDATDALRVLVSCGDEQAASEQLRRFCVVLGEAGAPAQAAGADRRGHDLRRHEDQRLRVDVQRLDDLMNAVGELVIDRTRVERRVEELKGLARDLSVSRRDLRGALGDLRSQTAQPAVLRLREVEVEVADAVANLDRATAALLEDSEALRRTTHTLQELLSQVRMMPIEWLHARLQRPLHEMARGEGKQVELVMDDESSQMDRSVAELLMDTLVQLLRNAVAHGIETPEARRAAGKPPVGRVRVTARHQGDIAFIQVEDDGAGLDPAQLRAALRAWGRLSEAEVAALSDREVLHAIFASGFSTRREADGLAGRGVGLDVVRQSVASLGGTISVTSTPGAGTCFTVQLPMTTAIAQALLVKVGEQVYVLPVAHVVETLFVEPGDLREDEAGHATLRSPDGWIPLLYLHQILGGDPPLPLQRARNPTVTKARQPVVVLRYGDRRFGVTCTRVIGTREVVLKRLGKLLSQIPLFAGATISGSSKVQFILDVAALARLASGFLGTARRSAVAGEPDDMAAGSEAGADRGRILLADDSRSIREAVGHILRAAGYGVDVAADGWDAWERLQLRTYDLLVTDLEMPRLHGYELIAKCRRTPSLARMPIVVLTSRTADRNREAALEKGANALVPKPINRRLVLAEISSLLGRST